MVPHPPRLALALALAFGAAGASALELGNARLLSSPGAALEIEVALLEVADGELETLKPQLPANSRSPSLASASIELGQSSSGVPVLRIRNATPVATDDVRFVVVADWGRGRRFREYLVSLNAPATPAAPAAATTASPASSTSTPPTSTSAAPSPPTSQQAVRLVRRNETLMSISREWSATTGVTLPQAMVGIFRANPTAFGPGGMSEMIVGSILTLPDAAALNAISPTAASSEVSRTLGIWRTGGAASARLSAPAPGTQTLTTAPAKPAAATSAKTAPPTETRAAPTPVPTPVPTLAPTATPAPAPATAPTPSAEPPVATPLALEPVVPAEPETPEAKAARLEADLQAAAAEVEALKARLAAAEAPSGPDTVGQGGWMAETRRWAAEVWWSIPALLLISLVLLIAFLVRGRRRAEAAEPAPRQEMTFDPPPIKAAQDADALLDAPLRAAPERIAPVAVPSISATTAAPPIEEDLEGDPPPVDEAGSKINLARAFIEMGQHDAAILELQAALRLGDETQRAEAIRLLDSLPKS
ncbi:MAG: FimV/HubP family polar landmark protein [Gammaproteobacteria bacterium]